jgi:phosphoglycolate phosphatase-like HAD superfamily hydrolase
MSALCDVCLILINAAHGAGMRAVGVTWGIHDAEEMVAMGFDVMVDYPRETVAPL